MKTGIFCLFALFAAINSPAQSLVFSNQTITVEYSNLSLEAVEFYSTAVATNTVLEWVDAQSITTNGMFDGGGIETNIVQQQVTSMVVSTNAAHWVADVGFSFPRGHQWTLSGHAVEIERLQARIAVEIDPAAVQAVFGSAAAGLEFAAARGKYQPSGDVRDAFLGLAATVLTGGSD